MDWQFAAADDIGGRSEQQDRHLLLHDHDSQTHLLIVADGVGGHGNGSEAAQAVIDTAADIFANANRDDPENFLIRLCHGAHEAIIDLPGNADRRSGSTCVALLLSADAAYWAHVGDSRLYLLRDGRLRQQTVDHSLAQMQRDAGTPEDQLSSSNQLYMCLGTGERIEPASGACRTRPGDMFVLCSDGLWGQVGDADLEAALKGGPSLESCVGNLVGRARERGADSGDNISLVVARAAEAGGFWAWLKRLVGG